MKFGCCIGYRDLEKLRILAELGYDYVELGLSPMRDAQNSEIEAFAKEAEKRKIPCRAVNVIFPAIPLTGEAADHEGAKKYLSEILEKTAVLGFTRAVFGSGGARRVPDNFPRERAESQLEAVICGILAPLGEKHGIVFCVEELNLAECNIINTYAEAVELAFGANHPNIAALADIYHMAKEKEPFGVISQNHPGLLAHAHFASPIERKFPSPADRPAEKEQYAAFFAELKKIGYTGGISIEAGLRDGADFTASAKESMEIFKSAVDGR